MSDLRTLHRTLVGQAVVTTPPYAAVVGRARRLRRRQSLKTQVVLAAVALLVSASLRSLTLDDAADRSTRVGGVGTSTSTSPTIVRSRDGAPPPSTSMGSTSATGSTPTSAGGSPTTSAAAGATCRAGANGGATGRGVTGTRIRLIATAHQDGARSALGSDAVRALRAVFDRANRGGGICGRRVDLSLVNRLFERSADIGAEDYLGMLAASFDPAFEDRLRDGTIDRWGIPVVGGDGAAEAQFSSAWSWPVAPPPATFARVAVDNAYRAGARTFAVVHDSREAFGTAVPPAVRQYVATLPGATVKVTVGLDPEKQHYGAEVNEFASACRNSGCDAILLALLPDTAKMWLQRSPPRARVRTAATHLLLSDRFAQDCAFQTNACDVWIWTGITPPVPSFTQDPDVKRYVGDVGEDRAENPAVATAYLAAEVMVAALRHAGPNLSRTSLQRALDSMTYRSGLVSTLDWGPRLPIDRIANSSMLAVRATTSESTFRGFVDAGTGWVRDPWPGRFPD